MAAKKFCLLLILLLLQSCGDTEVESLDEIFVRSDQERAELKIATELQISEPVFGKYIGPETSLTFEIIHTSDTVKIDFYHTSFCDGDPVESLDVITSRESSRIDYSKIKRNQTNYFSAKSFGPHGETIGCSNTIKFLQSADASSLDFMIVYEATDETCNLSGDTLDSILTNCNGVKFDFENLNDVLSSPLVSLKYYSSSNCSGAQSGSHDVETGGLQDSFLGLSEGSNDYSFKFKDERNKEVCVDFSVNKDTTAPVNATSFSLINPASGKVYENDISLDVEIEQADPPHQGNLKIFNTNDCSGEALYSKSLVSTDTTVNANLNFESSEVGQKNLYLYLEDKIGNSSCFAESGISYDVMAQPNFLISTVSPSSGDNIEITIENQIIGVNTQIYHTTDCTGESWYDISPSAAEDLTVNGLEISPGGSYNFSYISGDENSSTGCINSEATHDVFWRAPVVASISSSVDLTPNFLLTNISDQIADGLDISVDFFDGPGCEGDLLQTTNYTKSSSVSIELEDEVMPGDEYSYSFSYSYDGINSNCSEVSTFIHKFPEISIVDLAGNDPFILGGSSTSDTYLKLKINSLDEVGDKIISIHKDSNCLLKGFSQQFLLSTEDAYISTSLEKYFLDGPKEYPLYVRYEDLATGQSHCYEEASVTILFHELDNYSDFFDVDGDGNITEIKIDMYKHYHLTSSIDFSGLSFLPIGSEAEPFEGHFFGGGNRLLNLSMSSGDFEEFGIFGVQGKNSVIYEMTLDNVDLISSFGSDKTSTGLLVGKSYGTIERISIDSDSSVEGKVNTGGLVGHALGSTIRLCENEATVEGTDNVGGLVGNLDGAESYQVLADYFPPSSVVVNSGNIGNVTGKDSVGGLVGKMSGIIGYSFSLGNVSGEKNVGGLVGEINVIRPSILHSYSGSSVSGTANVAGLVGINHQTGSSNNIITNSYHAQETCYNYNPSSSTAKATCYDSPEEGVDAPESLIEISTLKDEGACNMLYFGCDYAYSVVPSNLPRINFDGVDPSDFNLASGSGLRSDPLIVDSIEEWLELESFEGHNHLHTLLNKDLTFNDDPDTFKFKPFNNRLRKKYFTGVLDGGHHYLNSITYTQNYSGTQRFGLLVGSSLGGEVKNIHFQDSTTNQYSYSSVIASYSLGGRFRNMSFDNFSFYYYGGLVAFVSGGESLGDTVENIAVVDSKMYSQNKNHASYVGFISAYARNSQYKDIIIRNSQMKDSEKYQLKFLGMVTGRADFFNLFDSISVEVGIDLNHNVTHIGGILGWAYINTKIENSYVTGRIDGGYRKLGGLIGGSYTVYLKNNISEITIEEKLVEKCYNSDDVVIAAVENEEDCVAPNTWKVLKSSFCGGFSGNNYKNDASNHNSIDMFNSVSAPTITCSGGNDSGNYLSDEHSVYAFNHRYTNGKVGYNFWFDMDSNDHVFSCYRADTSDEPNAPCTSIENLNGVIDPEYDSGTMEYFWDYFFFGATVNGGAEFSEDNWLDLGGAHPRVRGHPSL